MYHVIGTGLTTVILYLTSYFFYRTGYYSLQFHRKLWNSLLAITFIATALAGLFMAMQITYKWNVPFIKSILRWHVEFGIGMALTGLFHFVWHLSYFGKMLKKQETSNKENGLRELTSSEISLNLFIVGFVSSSVQYLLIREMMNIAGGYELITGTFLGSWLIGSAAGAAIAGRSALNDFRKINLVFSLAPVISILLLLTLSRLFLNTGETPSFLLSVIYTFIVLIPFCLVSGFTFVKLILYARDASFFVPGKSFSTETAGGIVSGIVISFTTAGLLNTYQLLLLIILLSSTYVLNTYYLMQYKSQLILKIIVVMIGACIIVFNPDDFFRQILLPGIRVKSSEDTPYGNITKGIYKGEQSVYYNQRLIYYNDDAIEREENIHYAMLQREAPAKVILISGSIRSNIIEVLKYPVKKVFYIERDPELIQSGLSATDTLPDKLVIEKRDAFRFIKNNGELVDVIILLVSPPSTLLLNRYYTAEFFGGVRKRLAPGGIFMCSPGPGDDYFNKESLNMYSSIFNSLAGVFKNVIPVVGNKLYFIASDKELSASFCMLSEMRKIKNIYVSSDYLNDDLTEKKSEEVLKLMNHDIKNNRSAYPVALFHFQAFNFTKNIGEKVPSLILLIMVFAIPVLTIKRNNILMYFSASALAGFEIILLLTLQLIMGNMYQLTGLVIAGLMTGLAIGAGTDIRLINHLSLRIRSIILIFFYLGIGLIYNNILSLHNGLTAIPLIIISAFIPAVFTGNLFRELTLRTDNPDSTSSTYSADLAGSAFGFILITGFTVPAIGIKLSLILLSVLIFTGFLFGTIRNK